MNPWRLPVGRQMHYRNTAENTHENKLSSVTNSDIKEKLAHSQKPINPPLWRRCRQNGLGVWLEFWSQKSLQQISLFKHTVFYCTFIDSILGKPGSLGLLKTTQIQRQHWWRTYKYDVRYSLERLTQSRILYKQNKIRSFTKFASIQTHKAIHLTKDVPSNRRNIFPNNQNAFSLKHISFTSLPLKKLDQMHRNSLGFIISIYIVNGLPHNTSS